MEKKFKIGFHHIGKPVPLEKIQNNAAVKYSPLFDMYSLDMSNELFIPIEWHAFGKHSPLDYRIQHEIHVAFTVSDIVAALHGKEIIMPLYQPFSGYRCAMASINGQLVEFIETSLSEREIWGEGIFKDSILYPDASV